MRNFKSKFPDLFSREGSWQQAVLCVLAASFSPQSHRGELKLSHFRHSSNQPIQCNALERGLPTKGGLFLSPASSLAAPSRCCQCSHSQATSLQIEFPNVAAFSLFAVVSCCYICSLLVSFLRVHVPLLVPLATFSILQSHLVLS